MDFGILGPLEVRHDRRPINVTGTRQRALLALLLLHAGEVVSSDRLMDELWGDNLPAAGTTALRVRVSQLRKALRGGDEVLLTQAPGYVLVVESGRIDVQRFERLVANGERALGRGDAEAALALLREALALWRGPPLAEFAYAAFAQVAIARLEELRLAALEIRFEAELALGRHAAVVVELQALVTQHPLRERLCAQLMLALYRDGRQADALAAYRAARRRLVDEIGIEPGPDLQALERRVLAQDPALGFEARGSAQPPRGILVLQSDGGAVEPLVAVVEPLAGHAGHELVIVALLRDGDRLAATTAGLNALREAALQRGVSARVAAFTTAERGRDVVRLVSEQDVALLVLDATEALGPSGVPYADAAELLARAVCDVALLAGGPPRTADPGGDVVVPFAGHEHDWAALEAGAWLADARGGVLRLLGVRSEGGGSQRDASRLLAHASLALQRGLGFAPESALVAAGVDGVLDAAADAALLVIGLSDRWAREGLGRTRLEIARRARAPVLFVRRGVRPGGLAPAAALTRYTWSAVRA